MRRLLRLALALSAVTANACGGVRDAEIRIPAGVYAVGSRAYVWPKLECPGPQREGIPCREDSLSVEKVTADDPGIFALRPAESGAPGRPLAFDVLRSGRTNLHFEVRRSDGSVEAHSATFEAREPTTVIAQTSCSLDRTGLEAQRYPAGTEVRVTVFLTDGKLHLLGRDFWPIEFGALEVVARDERAAGGADFTVRLPELPSSTTVTTTLDPTFALRVDGYAFSQVDGLALEAGPLRAGAYGFAYVRSAMGGEPACAEAARPGEPKVTIETPELCSLSPDGMESEGVRPWKFLLYGIAPGSCRVAVRLDGTTLSGTHEVLVR